MALKSTSSHYSIYCYILAKMHPGRQSPNRNPHNHTHTCRHTDTGFTYELSLIQFSRSVVSDSLRLHVLQQARPPCPSPTPGVHSNSRPSSHWCHPAISSSVISFSSCSQSLPASESFPMSQLFTWGGQSTGVSALASFLPICRVASDIMPGFRKSKKPPSLRGEQSDVNFVKVRQ